VITLNLPVSRTSLRAERPSGGSISAIKTMGRIMLRLDDAQIILLADR
jgi:hypothetical protein